MSLIAGPGSQVSQISSQSQTFMEIDHEIRTSEGGNGNHRVSLPINLIKIEVNQMLPSSYISLLLVTILWFCIGFPISLNVRLYFGAKMVTFCTIHIGNRKIFLKHHSPPPLPQSQLILLHVCVFSYFTWYMWKARWDSRGSGGMGGGGMISHHPKCDVWASPNISIWVFGVLSWKSFFSSIMKYLVQISFLFITH